VAVSGTLKALKSVRSNLIGVVEGYQEKKPLNAELNAFFSPLVGFCMKQI